MTGPLTGKHVVEMVGLGPAPFCGMMLTDMGAKVIRIDRPGAAKDGAWKYDILSRNRTSVCIDLKKPEGVGAMLEATNPGKGQVVDAAMTDGAALLPSMMYGFKAAGQWRNNRGANLLDGGAHFYDVYTCADGRISLPHERSVVRDP